MSETRPHEDSENGKTIELGMESWDARSIQAGIDLGERLACLRVEGSDAESFLQGQLTQDMAEVRVRGSRPAAHCTAQGRMTAIFDCLYSDSAFFLFAPASLIDAALLRLKKYVLRSKVTLSRVDDVFRIRVWHDPKTAPQGAPESAPERVSTRLTTRAELDTTLALYANLPRLSENEARLNEFLCQEVYLYPETAELFTPQMLNLDEIGGVSFKKGCYTGQEIVARAHYLGRVKRKMQLFNWRGEVPLRGEKIRHPQYGLVDIVDAIALSADSGLLLGVRRDGESE